MSDASTMTAEKIAKAQKFESIFMPFASAQRQRKVSVDNPADTPLPECKARYVHYTTAEGALRIIQNKRLWMRNTTCMADYREVQHGFDLLVSYFSDEAKRKALCGACDQSVPGKALEALKLFDEWWPHIQYRTYVASVSEHLPSEDNHGRLSMWRAFGMGQPRVALVISVKWISSVLEALQLSFSPVLYMGRNGTHAMLDAVVENVFNNREFLSQQNPEEVKAWIFTMLLSGVACVKHEGFAEEREWRAVCAPKMGVSELIESATEVIHGIPQMVYKIPLDETKSPLLHDLDFARILDRVIIGPSEYPVALADAFASALEGAGVQYPDSKLFFSDIPIRR